MKATTIVFAGLVLACSCAKPKPGWPPAEAVGVSTVVSASVELDPLPSWKAGPTKQAILDFVVRTTTGGNASFVHDEDRIATFHDNGTLWPEKPLPEAAFTIARLKAEVVDNPSLAEKEPWRSILEGDVDRVSSLDPELILAAIARTHSGMTDEAFELSVHTFLVDARHPKFGVPYPSLAYRPMRELLAYLVRRNFTIYLATAGDQGFVRAYAPGTWNIPRERIIGSSFAKELVMNGRAELRRKPQIATLNDREEKVVNIERHIGRRPLVAAGTVRSGHVRSGGDIAMLTYVRTRVGPSLALVVHHDDPVRELAYDEPDGATLAAAEERGFVVVSVRNDWTAIFEPPPPPQARGTPSRR